MVDYGDVTEDEMILAFVRAEVDSPASAEQYPRQFVDSGPARSAIIENAALDDHDANMLRKSLLDYRGFRARKLLFKGFPAVPMYTGVASTSSKVNLAD